MKQIKLGDIHLNKKQLKIISQIAKSGNITEGKYVEIFEKELAKFLGCKYAVACNSGTSALMLAIELLTRGNKGEVIVPAITFPATANAVYMTGNTVALRDVDKNLLLKLDETTELQIEILLRKNKIKGIIPVHLFGYPVDMNKLMEIKKRYDLWVIEDACESFGTTINGKAVGTFGDMGCFSFYVSHNIQAGELGAIITNNKKHYEKLKSLKAHGRTGPSNIFHHSYVGYNFKTTEFCAAIGYIHLKEAKTILKKRQNIVKYFVENIKNPKITFRNEYKNIGFLGFPMMAESVEYKQKLLRKLQQNKIETREMFPCLKNQKCYNIKGYYENANKIEQLGFYIGCHQYMTKKDLKKIVNVINRC